MCLALALKLFYHEVTSSSTGEITRLGAGYKPKTELDIIMQYASYKQAPVASLVWNYFDREEEGPKEFGQPSEFWEQVGGELDVDIYVPKELSERLSYMFMQDMYDIIQDDPNLIPLGVLASFGIGVQTYE